MRHDRSSARSDGLLATGQTIPSDHCVFIGDGNTVEEHWVDRLLRFGLTTPDSFKDQALDVCPRQPGAAPTLTVLTRDRIDRDRWLAQRGFAGKPIVLIQVGVALNKRQPVKWHNRLVGEHLG